MGTTNEINSTSTLYSHKNAQQMKNDKRPKHGISNLKFDWTENCTARNRKHIDERKGINEIRHIKHICSGTCNLQAPAM